MMMRCWRATGRQSAPCPATGRYCPSERVQTTTSEVGGRPL